MLKLECLAHLLLCRLSGKECAAVQGKVDEAYFNARMMPVHLEALQGGGGLASLPDELVASRLGCQVRTAV